MDRAAPAPRLATQIAEGLHHVLRNRELRALALTASLTNLGAQTVNTLLPVLFTRELGLSPVRKRRELPQEEAALSRGESRRS